MSQRVNPVAWLGWAAAAALLIVTTRNPLYLLLAGSALGAVHLSLDRRSVAQAAWGTVLRFGAVVAAISVLFNILTVHTGDRVLARLPDSIPIVGGPVTLNALVYGLVSALAIFDLLLLAAAFSAAVDRAALLRLVPGPLAAVGVAAIIGLSIFPQTLRAVREVREAQMARGFRIRSIRDVPPLLVPVLTLGLEHAFDLAETMESRAFGAGRTARIPAHWAIPAVAIAAASAVAVGLGYRLAAAVFLIPIVGLVVAARRGTHGRGRYRRLSWDWCDAAILATATLGVLLVVASIATAALNYSPYPRLTWPPFALAPGVAGLLIAAPALLPEGRRPA